MPKFLKPLFNNLFKYSPGLFQPGGAVKDGLILKSSNVNGSLTIDHFTGFASYVQGDFGPLVGGFDGAVIVFGIPWWASFSLPIALLCGRAVAVLGGQLREEIDPPGGVPGRRLRVCHETVIGPRSTGGSGSAWDVRRGCDFQSYLGSPAFSILLANSRERSAVRILGEMGCPAKGRVIVSLLLFPPGDMERHQNPPGW